MFSNSSNKVIGHIVAWWPERSYGFIHEFQPEANAVRKHFLHLTNIYSGTPAQGSIVRFTPEVRAKGSTAVLVEIFTNLQEMEQTDAATVLASSIAASTEVSK
jgi:hypothetical protein